MTVLGLDRPAENLVGQCIWSGTEQRPWPESFWQTQNTEHLGATGLRGSDNSRMNIEASVPCISEAATLYAIWACATQHTSRSMCRTEVSHTSSGLLMQIWTASVALQRHFATWLVCGRSQQRLSLSLLGYALCHGGCCWSQQRIRCLHSPSPGYSPFPVYALSVPAEEPTA